jgi:hypothetical protein
MAFTTLTDEQEKELWRLTSFMGLKLVHHLECF